jgi:hypothetical protein
VGQGEEGEAMSRVKKGALELAVGVGAIDLVQAEAKKEKQASLRAKVGL